MIEDDGKGRELLLVVGVDFLYGLWMGARAELSFSFSARNWIAVVRLFAMVSIWAWVIVVVMGIGGFGGAVDS